MTERNDQLVADYLSRVSHATAALPPARRAELLADLREHIDTDRADLSAETEVEVREILDRLGDPEIIARAAAEDAGAAPSAPHPVRVSRPILIIAAIVVVIVVLAVCSSLLFFGQSSSQSAV